MLRRMGGAWMTADLIGYARELAAEVEGAERGEFGGEFTRIVLDKLGDEGAFDNPMLLYQEGKFARAKYKITGFSVPDAEIVFCSRRRSYTGELPPRDLTATKSGTPFSQAMNFYKCSCKGLHTNIEPSNTEASDLARHIFEMRDQIDVLRVVLISDGLTGLKSVDLKNAMDGTRVIVDLYGIEGFTASWRGTHRDDIVVDYSGSRRAAALPQSVDRREDYDAYLTAIPAPLLADVYEKYGTAFWNSMSARSSACGGARASMPDFGGRSSRNRNTSWPTTTALWRPWIEIDISPMPGNLGIEAMRGLQM